MEGRRGVRPPPPQLIFLGGLHHVVAVRLGSVLRQGGWRDTEVTEMVEVTAVGGARAGGGPPPVEGLGHRLAQLAREGAPTAGVLAERRAAELRHGLASRTLQAPPRARLAPPRSLEAPAAVERDAILRRPSAAMQNASGVCVVGSRGDLIPKCIVPNLFWVWVPIWVRFWSQSDQVYEAL